MVSPVVVTSWTFAAVSFPNINMQIFVFFFKHCSFPFVILIFYLSRALSFITLLKNVLETVMHITESSINENKIKQEEL
jgi:hypothetical protein